MNRNFIILCVCSLFLLQVTFGQSEKSEQRITRNGEEFYVHNVEKKQTLYNISKLYDTSIDSIIAWNPEATEGIKYKQVLYIHIPKIVIKTIEYKTHVVEAKQTLYSISRMYGMTVDSLIRCNPGLTTHIEIGQELRIPERKQYVTTANSAAQNVQPEAAGSLADTYAYTSENSTKSSYKVALLMPLYLSEVSGIDVEQMKSIKDLNKKPFRFIEFYEGVLLALKHLDVAKPNIDLYVEDVTDSHSSLQAALNKPYMKDVDLIIGPLVSIANFKTAAEFAKNHQIPIINPFALWNDDILTGNNYVIKATANPRYTIENLDPLYAHGGKIHVVIYYNANDKELAKQAGILQTEMEKWQSREPERISFSTLKVGEGSLNEQLRNDAQNIAIVYMKSQVSVLGLLRANGTFKQRNVVLVGQEDWQLYDEIEEDYMEKANLHYAVNYFADYNDPETVAFIEQFREAYENDPEIARYAFQGYDIASYFCSALQTYGKNFVLHLQEHNPKLISTQFNFKPNAEGGIENHYLQIIRVEDIQLKDVRKILSK